MSDIRQAHLVALQAMQASLTTSAQNFVNAVIQRQSGQTNSLLDVEMAVQSAAQAYENSVNSVAATKQGNIGEPGSTR